jgi:hypothetical protein
MAANTTPVFTITPRLSSVRIATSNSNRDGTGTMGDVLTAALNGTRVDRITIIATGTTTAGMVRLFLYDGVSASRFWREVAVTAITPSGTVQAFTATVSSPDTNPLLVLPAGYVLRASTQNAETFDVTAHGGDY